MYAGAVGAWAVFLPAQYSTVAGVVGLLAYAVAAGLPILAVAFFGAAIQEKLPRTTALCDYAGVRYGPATRAYVVALSMLNMVVALLAEVWMGLFACDFGSPCASDEFVGVTTDLPPFRRTVHGHR